MLKNWMSNWNVFTKKTPGLDKFEKEIIPNISGTDNPNLKKIFPETSKRGKYLNSFLLISQIEKANTTKGNYRQLTSVNIDIKILTKIL